MNSRAIVFTIDALIALLFVGIMGLILHLPATEPVDKILINNRISDLLITSQKLEINNISDIEQNYKSLLGEKPGYVIINSKRKEINNKKYKTNIISQNIKYINSSNKEIYIEIGVYY